VNYNKIAECMVELQNNDNKIISGRLTDTASFTSHMKDLIRIDGHAGKPVKY